MLKKIIIWSWNFKLHFKSIKINFSIIYKKNVEHINSIKRKYTKNNYNFNKNMLNN